ncbi:DUF2911 domain-containing protein [Dokdonia sp.]|uniref:DUF2911 domain-containing protein n=1 Tax=Dokdonia sp. TaxID=2024995 RepID=UPI0032669915
MKKALKIGGIIIVILFAAGYGFREYVISQTKKASPEQIVNYTNGDTTLEVFYNRPYKKGRVIFGELVPYDITWRTGANEATTFETNTDLTIMGKTLPKGKYTLWTIPSATSWQVIFNDKMYLWGTGSNGASRDPEKDAIIVTVPVNTTAEAEQFTITLEETGAQVHLNLAWDTTSVSVPMTIQ